MPIPSCKARPKYNHKWDLDFKVGDDFICCQDCEYKQAFIALGPFDKGEIHSDFSALAPDRVEELKQKLYECWNDAKIRDRRR